MIDIVHSVEHTVITDESILEKKNQKLKQMWSDEYQQQMKRATQQSMQLRRKPKASAVAEPKVKEEEKAEDLLRLEGSQSSVKGSKIKLANDQGSEDVSKTEQPKLNIHRYFKVKSPSKEEVAGSKDQEVPAMTNTEAYR